MYIHTDSVSDTGAVALPILPSECKQPWVLFEIHTKMSNKKTYRMALNAPYNYSSLRIQYIHTKQIIFGNIDAGLEHMAARPRGNGRFLDRLS